MVAIFKKVEAVNVLFLWLNEAFIHYRIREKNKLTGIENWAKYPLFL